MSEKVGMTVFNLKVKDLYRLVKLDKSDASDGCSTPAFGVNDVSGLKLRRFNPSLSLHLERVSLCALYNLVVNIKFGQSVDLADCD